jgi:hypothetical protein
MKVEERKVSIDEWKQGVASGEISECLPAARRRWSPRSAS